MLLNETRIVEPIVENNDKGQLPEGVLLRVTYPICNIGERNANNRIYEDSVWEGVFGDSSLMDKIKARALFGHAEHPEQTQSNLEKTSHVICEMWKDGDTVFQKIDVLDTPTGRIVATLVKAGCNVGMSTRADGDLEESEDDDGKFSRVIPESYRYITTDFTADPSTWGAIPHDVQYSITKEARSVLESDDLHDGERQFAQMIYESFDSIKDKDVKPLKLQDVIDAGKIVEGTILKRGEEDVVVSITEGMMSLTINGEAFTAEGEGYVAIQADGTMYLCPESGVSEPVVDMPMMEEPAVGEELPEDEIMVEEPVEEIIPDEEEDELPESVEKPAEAAEEIKEADTEEIPVEEADAGLSADVAVAAFRKGDEEAIAALINEHDPMTFFKVVYTALDQAPAPFTPEELAQLAGYVKVIDDEFVEESVEDDIGFVDLQVQEASMRAERDKAIELLEAQADVVTDAQAAWKKDRLFEIKILTKKLTEAKDMLRSSMAVLSAKITEHVTTIETLNGQISEGKKLVESKVTDGAATVKTLEESITELKQVVDQKEVDCKSLTESHDKATAALEESHKADTTKKVDAAKLAVGAKRITEFVKSFIRIRVKESNLKLSRNSQTLLEECKTLEEVDSLMDEIVEAKRKRSALHTRVNEQTQTRRPRPIDPETRAVKKVVESVFEGMG